MWLNRFFKFMGRPRIRHETNKSHDKIGGKVLLFHLILNFVCLFVRLFFGCFFNRFFLKSFFLLFFFHFFCDNLPCSGMFRNVPGCSGFCWRPIITITNWALSAYLVGHSSSRMQCPAVESIYLCNSCHFERETEVFRISVKVKVYFLN